jgi:hypothetical protein
MWKYYLNPLRQKRQYMILPNWYQILIVLTGFLLMLLSCHRAFAQATTFHLDSIPKNKAVLSGVVDTGVKIIDSGYQKLKENLINQRNQPVQPISTVDSMKRKMIIKKPFVNVDSLLKRKTNPYENMVSLSSPFFKLDGGYAAYNYNYHSTTDTPYAETNISQNMVNASINFTIEKFLPFTANAYISRSNSQYFRNITDVQVIFNAAAFKNQFTNSLKQMYAALADSLKNDQLEKKYLEKAKELLNLKSWLHNPFQLQKLIQANETVNIPQKSYNPSLSDSANLNRTDSLQSEARAFIKTYNQEKARFDEFEHLQDSLGLRINSIKSLISRYKNVLTNGANPSQVEGIEDSLRRLGVKNVGMPEDMNWLLGVRNFSIGKAPVNYTELTARNISVTGINFEYNNLKYYYAICGGLIDYRFNSPVVNSPNKVSQYMYMFRAGLGRVESNHFILSFYQGKKQIFTAADSAGSLGSIPISGISAETRVNINSYSFLLGEVAESFSPDYHFSPTKTSSGLNFSDKTNKALSLKAYAYLPFTGTRLEAMYKYTGSNFQSFSSFQTNAALKSWYVKADQFFWERKLRLSVSVKTSDFSNPYIVQNYNSNTVFTSISASFRSRHFPFISVGYMPMSQLTAVGSEIVENKFQILTANINHYYKIGSIRASSTGVLSKFYNNGSDTSFVFYNATNILFQQSFFFKEFTGSLNFSRSASARYELNVVGEEIDLPFSKRGSIGIGCKLNSFNKTEMKIGQVFNFNYQIGRMDFVSVSAERGYLPGTSGILVHNDFGNVQFVKRF